MTGAGAVVALVLLEWTVGLLVAASWSQTWAVVRRGHFRIIAWSAALLCVLAAISYRSATTVQGEGVGLLAAFVIAFVAATFGYVLAQYSRTDVPGALAGSVAGLVGAIALVLTTEFISGWPPYVAALELLAGAALLGAVTNGLMLGHWYLNQPGLKPWALSRISLAGLVAAGVSAVLGLFASGLLRGASTEGAVLGLPGFGESFAPFFYLLWLALIVFTGVVLWLAWRCVKMRSIQSATGLYYVALLTAGVSEFVVRYLMVHA